MTTQKQKKRITIIDEEDSVASKVGQLSANREYKMTLI